MSVYLGELDAYDPQEFGSDVQSLIMESIEKVALKDLFDSESSFYENLIQEIKDALHEFCDAVADEAYEKGEEYGRESGYERGYEDASDEMYSAEYVSDLEENLSNLRGKIDEKNEEIEALENDLEEARQSSVSIDLDEIRAAVKADLLAEMTPDDSDYED